MKLKFFILAVLITLSTNVLAGGCVWNQYGKRICTNNNGGGGFYRPPAAVTYHGYNGVNRTYGANGGRAVTRNGYGAVRGPGGTTCARGRYHSGCR
jgi:hypothetical protein